MENDPTYLQLVKKSHILQKYYSKHPKQMMPQVPKQQKIIHRAIATGFVSSLIHILAYPLDTLKVRKMANNKFVDIARFKANAVPDKSLYLGFFKGYLSLIIANITFLTVGQESFYLGVAAQAILKTFIDTSKVSSQMANQKLDMQVVKRTLGWGLTYSFLRDLTSRASFIYFTSYMMEQHKTWVMRDRNNKYHIFLGSAVLSTIVSHPFDIVFNKIASQRSVKYGLTAPLVIFKQQGWKKFVSGIEFRLAYNLIGVIMMSNFYEALTATLVDAL